ncbi:MAG: LapA family protein [Candidatus Omnitrophica bacterium]|nr:LapA family protein [Candidatus Omnitrophota bacterium]MBU1997816.1 LapA family protein [Candidatus Omnitrophota bacterium]MBU4333622.1 LapA family protein [Candidatus Omnitrophota bacterium]
MKSKVIVGIILGVLLLIFLLQNTQVVSVRFLFWKLSMSRIILLPIVMFIGIAIGFFVGKKSVDW